MSNDLPCTWVPHGWYTHVYMCVSVQITEALRGVLLVLSLRIVVMTAHCSTVCQSMFRFVFGPKCGPTHMVV